MEKSPCILLAQSRKSNADALSSILSEHGFSDFIEAFDGIDAVKLFEEKRPEIVFVDIDLPLANGITVLERIKKTASGCVAAITSSGYDKKTVEASVSAGSDGFIVEPFESKHIIPWLIVSIAEKKRSEKLKKEFDSVNSAFNSRLDFEKAVGKFAEENKIPFEKAKKRLEEISLSKNLPIEKIIEIFK